MEAGCGHFKCSSHILVRSRKKNGSWKNENTKHEKAKLTQQPIELKRKNAS
jgi:hypothetical protein